jgi:hypothetical protein
MSATDGLNVKRETVCDVWYGVLLIIFSYGKLNPTVVVW